MLVLMVPKGRWLFYTLAAASGEVLALADLHRVSKENWAGEAAAQAEWPILVVFLVESTG